MAKNIREASVGGATFEMSCIVSTENLGDVGYSVLIQSQESLESSVRTIMTLSPDSVLQHGGATDPNRRSARFCTWTLKYACTNQTCLLFWNVLPVVSSETISSLPSPVRLNLGSDSLASSCLTEVITGVTSQRGLNSSQDKHGPKPPVQSPTKSGLTFKKMVGLTSYLNFVYVSSHGSKSVLLICTLVLLMMYVNCSFNCSLVGCFEHNW